MRTLTLIALSALTFAACGGTEAPAGDAPEAVAPDETTPAAADAHGEEAQGEHGAADDAHAAADGEWASFGEPMASDNNVALADLLDSPDTYTGQTVRVQGTIADVCQVAGCWMVMADGERTMRITMKDHGFAVDKGAATRTGEVEGVVIARPADPERAAHFASEAANPDAMPENSGAEMLYEISATGVRIQS